MPGWELFLLFFPPSLSWLGTTAENRNGKQLPSKQTVDSACRGAALKSSTCLVPFVIYSSVGAVFSSRRFLCDGFNCLKTKHNQKWRSRGPPYSSTPWARFSALILSLQCTHPIQLGSVMGLLCRVEICAHFSRLDTTIRAATTWDQTSSSSFLPLSLLLTVFFSVLLYFMV